MSPPEEPRRRPPLTIGWEAVRANAVPAFIIQALMLAVLVGYFFHPGFASLLHQLADVKRTYGIAFVVIATVLAGSILPELSIVLLFQRGHVRPENLRNVLFTAPVWAIAGITVDLMYRGLAAWLGDQATVGVVAAKICIDQFVYNVFFAAPYTVIAYEWKNSGFSFAALRGCFTLEYYKDKIVPTLLTNWAVWIPLIGMIYSLPLALQFPLFSLALTFWVLLLTYMTNRFAGKSGRPVETLPSDAAPQPAR
jgi:hypothetical protein